AHVRVLDDAVGQARERDQRQAPAAPAHAAHQPVGRVLHRLRLREGDDLGDAGIGQQQPAVGDCDHDAADVALLGVHACGSSKAGAQAQAPLIWPGSSAGAPATAPSAITAWAAAGSKQVAGSWAQTFAPAARLARMAGTRPVSAPLSTTMALCSAGSASTTADSSPPSVKREPDSSARRPRPGGNTATRPCRASLPGSARSTGQALALASWPTRRS